MTQHQVECAMTLRRSYAHAAARTWRAWTDARALARWYVAAADQVVHFAEADARIGGSYRVGFGPPGEVPWIATGRYLDVAPQRHLVFEASVSRDGPVFFTQHTTVTFAEIAAHTQVAVTCAGADAWRTGDGWTQALESLATWLDAGPPAPEDSALRVRRSILIAADAAAVWAHFTTHERMARWWGAVDGTPEAGTSSGQWLVEYEPMLGGRMEMEVMMDGERARFGGAITRFEVERELTLANDWIPNRGWRAPTWIALRLSPAPGGTLVELFHYGFERASDSPADEHAGYEAGWGMKQLLALQRCVAGSG